MEVTGSKGVSKGGAKQGEVLLSGAKCCEMKGKVARGCKVSAGKGSKVWLSLAKCWEVLECGEVVRSGSK